MMFGQTCDMIRFSCNRISRIARLPVIFGCYIGFIFKVQFSCYVYDAKFLGFFVRSYWELWLLLILKELPWLAGWWDWWSATREWRGHCRWLGQDLWPPRRFH